MDLAVTGEELLGVLPRLETLHLPFSPSCRLMQDLGPAVEVAALAMLDPGQDLPFGGAIAAKFIGYDHTGHVLQPFEQLLEEPPGRLGIASALHQDVEHGTVLVEPRRVCRRLQSLRGWGDEQANDEPFFP